MVLVFLCCEITPKQINVEGERFVLAPGFSARSAGPLDFWAFGDAQQHGGELIGNKATRLMAARK